MLRIKITCRFLYSINLTFPNGYPKDIASIIMTLSPLEILFKQYIKSVSQKIISTLELVL